MLTACFCVTVFMTAACAYALTPACANCMRPSRVVCPEGVRADAGQEGGVLVPELGLHEGLPGGVRGDAGGLGVSPRDVVLPDRVELAAWSRYLRTGPWQNARMDAKPG